MLRILILISISAIFCFYPTGAKAGSLFQYERIDFFRSSKTEEKPFPQELAQSPEVIVDEWAEPIISPSGKVSIYLPPKEVRDFLDNPDPQSARAYLEWNLKRIKKFILAQALLTKEAKEIETMKKKKTLLESNDKARASAGYLFYFMLKGCPLCEEEAQVIEEIYLTHPEIRIEAFARGFSDSELEQYRFPARQDKGMSGLFKVTTYPAIAVFNRKNKKYILSGFMNKESILRLFE